MSASPLRGLLDGQVAFVAGGGRGIGAAVATGLAAAGASVVVADLDKERAEEVRDTIVASGGHATAEQVDLREEEHVDAVVTRIAKEFGRIDALVNVAGGMVSHAPLQPLHRWTRAQWSRVTAINLDYVFLTCRAVLGPMIESGGGSIVNIGSTSGLLAAPLAAPYGASKAALMSLTRTLAVEYGRFGIRVNAVAAGSIDTPAATGKASKAYPHATSMIPLQRRGTPRDVEHVVVFLTSGLAGYVTGHTVVVDGGISLRFPLPLPGADASEAAQA